MSIDALMKALLPFGLWVPVLPGTRQVTIGGAIAADVHGKNHHTQGSFGNHVRDLDLLTADGEIRTVGPDGDDPELFWATVGGMGLTGVILRATVAVQRTETAYFTVDTQRCGDLDELMATMTDGDENYTYSVAWFDAVTRGKHLGRAVLTRGNKAKLSDLPAKLRNEPLRFAAPSFGTIPEVFPNRMVNLATAKAFSAMWFRKAPKHRVGEVQNITTFFHPLDIVAEWNRVYGPNGFLQYQFAVPFAEHETFRRCVEMIVTSGHLSCLNVLKRFGPGNAAPLSFPMPGWTLTVDLPIEDGLDRLCTASTNRSSRRAAGATWPRTPGWTRPPSARCTPGSTTSSPSGSGSTRLRCSPPTCRGGWTCEDRPVVRPPDHRPRQPPRGSPMIDAVGNPQSLLLLGGTSDIALAIARRYAIGRQLRVVLAARPTPRRTESAAELTALGCTVTEVDLEARDPGSHAATIDAAFAGGDIDIAVVAFGLLGDAERAWTDPAEALELVEVNYTAPVHLGRAAGEPAAGPGARQDRGAVERGRRAGPSLELRVRVHQGRSGRVLPGSRRGAARERRRRARGPTRVRPLQDDRGSGRGAAGRHPRGRGRRGGVGGQAPQGAHLGAGADARGHVGAATRASSAVPQAAALGKRVRTGV